MASNYVKTACMDVKCFNHDWTKPNNCSALSQIPDCDECWARRAEPYIYLQDDGHGNKVKCLRR